VYLSLPVLHWKKYRKLLLFEQDFEKVNIENSQ
jgi:hypothetical protein